MTGIRVATVDRDGTPRKLTKLFRLADGGFAIAAPYHSSRRGFLFEFPVDYSRRWLDVSLGDTVAYTAEDRVKLSLHLDGFVQFSGERAGRILSGRDELGRPRGLGLVANQLTRPLATGGPTFCVLAWGIEDFEPATDDALVFRDEDVYYRDCLRETWTGCCVEGFVLPRRAIRWAGVREGGRLVLRRRFPNYESIPTSEGLVLPTRHPLADWRGAIFELTVVDVGSLHIVVALLVSRVTHDMESSSGFSLSSPSDLRRALMAIYPNPLGRSRFGATSLDYGQN